MPEHSTSNHLTKRIQRNASGKPLALLLFGSHARGDAKKDSDIDVLQVVNRPSPSYQKGQINYSVYTSRTLDDMARKGSLFILHLLTEGIAIFDPLEIKTALQLQFKPQPDYSRLRQEVCHATALLDTTKINYHKRWRRLHALALNLLRTYIYTKLYDQGQLTFSIDTAALRLKDQRISSAMELKTVNHPDIRRFKEARQLLEEYCGHPARNEFGSIEALITNAHGRSELTTSLGLRLLNESEIPMLYEDFLPPDEQQ
ncbi:nucleotidyltransferase domain-containing protein [Corallococcus exiguus]|uniref:nucleotidyltransferase domain-containing protein n=1 Tax=Corallococcus exiguus TaxID=83462 RepID=UPI0015615B50|nr:nucleotidyltransferase domain-containing protein [Corallococcus exiguus]NRD55151.1 nucleotidyltransferase domain-containing protein [Corallococcus exiguus]